MPGFDLWVGGGLSTNPRFAERLGVFVRPDEVSEVWAGVISVFRDYGYRRSRNHARLKFLMADWGPEKFREVLQDEYLHRALPDGAAAARLARAPRPHRRASAEQRPVLGRRDDEVRTHVRRRRCARSPTSPNGSAAAGSALTAQQGIVVAGRARGEHRDAGRRARRRSGSSVRPSAFLRGTIACTGIEFCKLALVETKVRAETIRQELEQAAA